MRRRLQHRLIATAVAQCPQFSEAIDEIADHASVGFVAGGIWATKGAIRRSLRRMEVVRQEPPSQRPPQVVLHPTQILQEHHRPSVFAGLVEPAPAPRSLAPMATILADLQARLRARHHPYPVLDWLRCTSCLNWQHCAEILAGLGHQIDSGMVRLIVSSRDFWDGYWRYCRHWRNAAQLGQIDLAVGDWALVEAHELPGWLPGLHIPKMHRRKECLVRLIHRGGSSYDLDFHAISYLPLFRVPV